MATLVLTKIRMEFFTKMFAKFSALLGFISGLMYTWAFLTCMILRDVDCIRNVNVIQYLIPEYAGWIILFLAQLTALLLFWCRPCHDALRKRVPWVQFETTSSNGGAWNWIKNRVKHFNLVTRGLFVGEFRKSNDFEYVRKLFSHGNRDDDTDDTKERSLKCDEVVKCYSGQL